MAASNLAIPAAIVLSSVIVATGLYLGLRQPVLPANPGPSVGVAVPEVVSVPPAMPPVMTPEIKARATEDAKLALETVRTAMVERCWTPAASKQPEPRQIPLMFNVSFSAQGGLVAFGISEDRTSHRPEVAGCLRALELRLQIPPPGSPVMVEVPVTLP